MSFHCLQLVSKIEYRSTQSCTQPINTKDTPWTQPSPYMNMGKLKTTRVDIDIVPLTSTSLTDGLRKTVWQERNMTWRFRAVKAVFGIRFGVVRKLPTAVTISTVAPFSFSMNSSSKNLISSDSVRSFGIWTPVKQNKIAGIVHMGEWRSVFEKRRLVNVDILRVYSEFWIRQRKCTIDIKVPEWQTKL